MRTSLKALTVLPLLLPILVASQAVSGYSAPVTNPNDAIERYRKGDVVLRLLDDMSRPITRASIRYRQTTKDFLFGVGAGPNYRNTWLLLREAGINYVEMYLSWNVTDSPGAKGWILDNLSTLDSMGFVTSGHCLVWMVGSYPDIPGADPWNLPGRVKNLKYDALKNELYNHVYETVLSYKSFVTYWDVNEPFWPYADPFYLNDQKWIEIVNLSVEAIRKADPQAKIYLNNILGDLPAWNYYPIKHMKLLTDMGIKFDVIGVELYGQPRASLVPVDSKGYPALPSVSMRLDQYGRLGKPIILTEVDVSNTPGERAQAEWLKSLYTMAFGKPYVKGIAWSFMFDDPFLPGAGIFDCKNWDQYHVCYDVKPRQAYYALKNLTSSWLTEGNGTTDAEGRLRFRGYAGDYSITAAAEGFDSQDTTIHAQEQVESQFEIRLHTKTVPATIVASTSTLATPTVNASALSQQQASVAVVAILATCLVFAVAVTRARKKTR